MSGQEAMQQPLLEDQEISSAWDQEAAQSSEAAARITTACTVQSMFKEHPHDVLRFLQTSGVEKIAEFSAEDAVVFRAFGDGPILTFGSDKRWLDAEAEWRSRLAKVCKTGESSHLDSKGGWSNHVSVEAFVVTIKDAAASVDKGLLHPLIQRWQAKRCSFAVFTLPAVQATVLFKWSAFARRILFAELILYCIWLVSYYTFCAAMQEEDLSMPLSSLLGTSRGQLTVAAEIISLFAMVPFLMLEAGTITAYGWGWLKDPTNFLDMTTYALQIGISTLHLGRFWLASQWLTYCLAVQCILLMFRLQYFTQVLRPTRFSFASIVREVVQDTGWVFIFILLTCIGFGTAFHITFRAEDESPEGFSTYIRSVLSTIEHLYGDLDLKDFVNSKEPVFATMLALSFIFVMGYCLINLLLGMIINSVDRVLEHEGSKLLCNQARIINEIEAFIPSWFERRQAAAWHPPYIHVLRINPNKLDAVEMDALWTKHGGEGPVMMASAGGGGSRRPASRIA